MGQQSNQRSAPGFDQWIESQQNQSDQRLNQQSSQQSASPLAPSDTDSSGVDASSSTEGPGALAEQQQSSVGQSSQLPVSSSRQATVSKPNPISDDSSNHLVDAGSGQSLGASSNRTDEDIQLNSFRSRDSGDTAQEQPVGDQQSSGDASSLGNQVASAPEAQQQAFRANPASAADDVGPTNGISYWQDQAASVQAAQKLSGEGVLRRVVTGQDESDQGPYQNELKDSEEIEPLEVEQMSFGERLQAGRECFR